MKPFSSRNQEIDERVFNYRLSRARRTIENSFGILSARFRVLRTNIEIKAVNVNNVVAAACVSHNFLLSRNSRELYAPPNFVDRETENGEILPGEWRMEHESEPNISQITGRLNKRALENRNELKDYFMYEGAVEFQYDHV